MSPYTRYGMGEINSKSYGRSNAMGDLSTTLRSSSQINIGNPASYTAQDTMSFIFDVGLNARIVNYKTEDDNMKLNTATMDHLAIGFPITRKLKVSTGLYPYSFVGYNIANNGEMADTSFTQLAKNDGDGGITKFYFGGAYEISPGLSAGFNANYLFGNINYINESSVYDSDPEIITTYLYRLMDESITRINGVCFDFGLQYAHKFGIDHTLNLGLTYSPKTNIKSSYNKQVYTESAVYSSGVYSGTLEYDTISTAAGNTPLELPAETGLGLAYEYQDKVFIGVEYRTQNWKDFEYPTMSTDFEKLQQFSIGTEVTPNPRAFTGYYNIIRYRAGAYYKENYLNLNNTRITDFGFTLGLGLPMGGKTMINVSYKYGNRGTTDMNLIQESYNQVNIGFSFYDFWFIKSKYD